MNEQQISELEIKVAFLEQAIQDLSEEFLAQQKDLPPLTGRPAVTLRHHPVT